jgi:hypothetical protein
MLGRDQNGAGSRLQVHAPRRAAYLCRPAIIAVPKKNTSLAELKIVPGVPRNNPEQARGSGRHFIAAPPDGTFAPPACCSGTGDACFLLSSSPRIGFVKMETKRSSVERAFPEMSTSPKDVATRQQAMR